MKTDQTRRDVLRNAAVCAAAAAAVSTPGSWLVLPVSAKEAEKEPEVTATEDLMREHGVIRRALLVYFETVPRLRQNPASVDPTALRQTAQLFRTFAEDYHERMLEEQHIFPLVRKQGGELQRYADILTAQHNRGREITDYVLAVSNGPKIGAANAEPLAKVFESFVLMYENHAAREDTIIFPAWKKNFSNKQLDEISDQFEDIEHKMFGKDGFDDAEKKISSIEGALGFADLTQFTPPPPPTPKKLIASQRYDS
ncbi:MAG TPA: hemerythrin domain-containing protein [Candidatus Polarisedimenticolia bacterium]|nr:hemerythrin domain-containing protein [Candidatus Polarisedimenticolia bacterium]